MNALYKTLHIFKKLKLTPNLKLIGSDQSQTLNQVVFIFLLLMPSS